MKSIDFLNQIIDICRGKDAHDKENNPEITGDSFIVSQLELLKELIEKENKHAAIIVDNLLKNEYPWDLMQIRRELREEFGEDATEEEMQSEAEVYCSEKITLECQKAYYNASKEAKEWLNE